MKPIKKIVTLILVTVIAASCCSCFLTDIQLSHHKLASAAEKMSVNSYDNYHKDDAYKAFLDKIRDFSARLTDSLIEKYGKSENVVISPVSVYMALSLACECAEGETRQEILDAVGVSYDEVKAYTSRLYAFCNDEHRSVSAIGLEQVGAFEQLTNSIWLDEKFTYVQGGVNSLAQNYNCDVFRADLSSNDTSKLINEYIKDKTHGLIDGDIELSPETVFVLMNTYYLKDIWNDTGRDLELTSEKYSFINRDGSVTEEKLLQGYYGYGRAYEGDGFGAFRTTTEHGYGIYFIVPSENTDIGSVFTSKSISEVLSITDWNAIDEEKMEEHYTRVLFPEFEADFGEDIKSTLTDDFGITSLFSPLECNVSNIFEEPAYCESVIHKATLSVNKKGIEGAAITIMQTCGTAGPGEFTQVYNDFIVDRAFGFMVVDGQNTVLFSGIINSLK